MRARFARIYPLHFFVLLIAIPFVVLAEQQADVGSWSLALVLLHPFNQSLGWQSWGPSWSISIEAMCYLLLPYLLVKLSRTATPRLAGVALLFFVIELAFCALMSASGLNPKVVQALTYFNPLARVPEFLIGAVVGMLYLRRPSIFGLWSRQTLIFAALIWIFCAAIVVSELDVAWYTILFIPGFVLLVAGLAWGPTGMSAILGSRPLMLMGDASYSVYLLHCLPLLILVRVQAPFAVSVAMIILTLAASVLSWRYVEVPSRHWLRTVHVAQIPFMRSFEGAPRGQ